MNNISVTTSGLLTGSRNYRCGADTWMLSAQPGQYIEVIVRDYTLYDVATSSSDDEPAAAAADDDDDDDDDVGDMVNDRNSRSEMYNVISSLTHVLSYYTPCPKNAIIFSRPSLSHSLVDFSKFIPLKTGINTL